MDIDLIERLMRLLETSDVNELEVSENGMRIRLSKTATQPARAQAASAASAFASDSSARASASGSKDHVVVAGLPGTFYRSPFPGEPPFVEVGDTVEDGRKLGIIEAMKMMNPVEADCVGMITAIHLDDGAPVTAGMPLFSIARSA
ncbi:MAG TPA: biotin/lipoyl-containing protein [Pararhizobium sp.]|uniref:acetyl-CoA carboxylase biotin carboxyl carrier protein n=1 Tax=Pararhizobium sp. TaxID=1977563 RepID=UPI002C3F7C58|nr:biotin/lipoyl-containing protein [Pararhizobium sp.]HTO33322.1 biotin/lipoyl-containing protein [Pararhizobium sp.]